MNDPQKEAREIAERHGIKAYEPPAETTQEPCECRTRKALESIALWLETERGDTNWPQYEKEAAFARAALSDPCSCEQLRGEYDRLGLSYVVLEGQYECAVQIIREERAERDRLKAECEQLREDRAKIELRCNWADAGKRIAEADAKSYSGIITNTISVLMQEFFRLSPNGDLPSAGSCGGQISQCVDSRDVAQDSAALWTKNAFTAVGELHAARSLLEEARLALTNAHECISDVQEMTRTHEEVPQWGWPDYNQQMKIIRRTARGGAARADAALAKIEASLTPKEDL